MATLGYIESDEDDKQLSKIEILDESNTITSLIDSNGIALTTGDVTVTAGDLTVTAGDVTVTAGDLFLPSSGGTPSALNHYEEYFNNSATWGGAIVAGAASSYRLTRIGNIVHMSSPTLLFTADAASAITLSGGSLIPSRFRPVTSTFFTIIVQDAAVSLGSLEIAINGEINIYDGVPTNAFSIGASRGFYSFDIMWNIDS